MYNSIHVLHEGKEMAIEIFLKQVWDGSNQQNQATSQCSRYNVGFESTA